MKPKDAPTALDLLVTQAVDCLRRLRKLDGSHKLTARAFLAEAMEGASCDVARLETLDKMIDKMQSEQVRGFVNWLVKQFKEPTYPRCPTNPQKMLRIYPRHEGVGEQLAELASSAGEAIVLAAWQCGKRYPDAFGDLKSWDSYQRELKSTQRDLDRLYDRMRVSWGAADLVLDTMNVTPTQRELKLMLAWFVRWDTISLAEPNWPAQIVSAAFATEPAPAKSPRRIERRKPTDNGRHSGPPVQP